MGKHCCHSIGIERLLIEVNKVSSDASDRAMAKFSALALYLAPLGTCTLREQRSRRQEQKWVDEAYVVIGHYLDDQ